MAIEDGTVHPLHRSDGCSSYVHSRRRTADIVLGGRFLQSIVLSKSHLVGGALLASRPTLAAARCDSASTMVALILLPLVSPAVLPPGYEDTPWCPPGSCLEQTRQPDGFTGPQSAFVHCHDPESKVLALGAREVQEIWTGSKVATEPPDGWVVASPCPPYPMPPPPPPSPPGAFVCLLHAGTFFPKARDAHPPNRTGSRRSAHAPTPPPNRQRRLVSRPSLRSRRSAVLLPAPETQPHDTTAAAARRCRRLRRCGWRRTTRTTASSEEPSAGSAQASRSETPPSPRCRKTRWTRRTGSRTRAAGSGARCSRRKARAASVSTFGTTTRFRKTTTSEARSRPQRAAARPSRRGERRSGCE